MTRVRSAPRQRGVSLVELLISVALGLLLLTGALGLLHSHLLENRRLIVEGRLMAELRSAADVIARDLRRAGHWADAGAALRDPQRPSGSNPYGSQWSDASEQAMEALRLSYSRDLVENHRLDSTEQFGFRLRQQGIDIQLGDGNWQALTDPSTIKVTRLTFTPHPQDIPLGQACDDDCVPDATHSCQPRLRVRLVDLVIEARSALDARLTRALQTSVRVRNDSLLDACEQ